jgi:hypothetical protein
MIYSYRTGRKGSPVLPGERRSRYRQIIMQGLMRIDFRDLEKHPSSIDRHLWSHGYFSKQCLPTDAHIMPSLVCNPRFCHCHPWGRVEEKHRPHRTHRMVLRAQAFFLALFSFLSTSLLGRTCHVGPTCPCDNKPAGIPDPISMRPALAQAQSQYYIW